MSEEERPPRIPTQAWGVPIQPVHITPDSNVSMPLWRFLAVMGLVVSGAIAVWAGYARIQDSIRAQGERLAAIDGKLAQFDAAKVRDMAREVVREELQHVVIECARQIRRGEVAGPCKAIFPARKD